MLIFSILGPPTTAGWSSPQDPEAGSLQLQAKKAAKQAYKTLFYNGKVFSANNPMYVEFKASNQDEEEEEDGDDDEDGEDDD